MTSLQTENGTVQARPQQGEPKKPRVCLALPSAKGWISRGAAHGGLHYATFGAVEVAPLDAQSSALCHNFNGSWAAALSGRKQWGFTHFAMLHDDVQPLPGWLDVLYAELERTKVDVVSTIIPIGSPEGLTSTAVASPDPWWTRRITMTEAFKLPETFTTNDVCPDFGPGPLLINTGCWLAKLTEPWCDQMTEDGELDLTFRTGERIIRLPEGQYAAQFQSEDWLFARWLHERGVPYAATRKVGCTHLKEIPYSNREPWGTKATDEKFFNPEAKQVSALREKRLCESAS